MKKKYKDLNKRQGITIGCNRRKSHSYFKSVPRQRTCAICGEDIFGNMHLCDSCNRFMKKKLQEDL